MKILKIVTAVILLSIILLAWLTPLGPVPGFFIGGSAAAIPDRWGDTATTHEIRLQVQGTLPRVVIIWVVQVNSELYVVGNSDSGWVTMLGEGGSVRMRMGDQTYDMQASLVSDDWQTILEAYMDKYRPDYPDIVNGFPSLEDAKGTISVFQLSAS